MRLRSGKTYADSQSKESQSSTAIDTFDKANRIALVVSDSEFDFKKIDARIKINPNEDELLLGGTYVGIDVIQVIIYAPKACHEEIIAKLKNNTDILIINRNITKSFETRANEVDPKAFRAFVAFHQFQFMAEDPSIKTTMRLPSYKQTEKMLMRPLNANTPAKKHLDEPTIQNERARKRQKTTIEPVSDSTKTVAPLSNAQLLKRHGSFSNNSSSLHTPNSNASDVIEHKDRNKQNRRFTS